ncbi:cytidylyltransferase domain-containing protein [Crateriforma spongiae]|uniref:cytidylyltransferase domain-containing protein n=1 Tax=Crateriforma spongiae TaxID=2724528 RepID=UPI0039B0670E
MSKRSATLSSMSTPTRSIVIVVPPDRRKSMSSQPVVCIIQARVGSSRLPGKTLRKLGDRTVLARVLTRVGMSKAIDRIVVATTDDPADDAIRDEALRCGVDCFRGDEFDVLARYHGAAVTFGAQHVVRVTSDCPLIDASLIDRMVEHYLKAAGRIDYLSNGLVRTFPHGLDTEIFSAAHLAIAFHEATDVAEREHVTPFLYRNPDRFRLENFAQGSDQSQHRWTLDEPDDLRFFEAVVDYLPDPRVSTTEVLALLEQHPELARINASVRQKTLAESTMTRGRRRAA